MKLFWKEITLKIVDTNNKQLAMKKKWYVWSVSWNTIGSIFSWLTNWDYMISLQTFYDLYKMNGDIRQAISKIAKSVSRNGLYLVDNQNNIVDDALLTDEIYWLFKTPTFLKFKTDLYRNYFLSWELYIIPIYNLKWEVYWFQVLDSRLVLKDVDKYGNIIKFVAVNPKTSEQKVFKPDELAYFKLESDVNHEVNWMWLLHGVVYDWLSDLEALKTNYALYVNNSIPNSILLLNDDLTENEIKIAKEQFDLQFRWSENAHKMLIGWWIKDIKTISITPRDMEFLNQRKMTTEKISAVFGVPKSILWYVDNVNYSNGREMKKEFLEWTIRPYEEDFENIINVLLDKFVPQIYENYWLKCDWEQLEETQEWYEWQRKDVERWILTINEVRIDRWLEPSNEENCNKHLVSRNAILLEDVALDASLYGGE